MIICPICETELIKPAAIVGARIRMWCPKCSRHIWIGPAAGSWEENEKLWADIVAKTFAPPWAKSTDTFPRDKDMIRARKASKTSKKTKKVRSCGKRAASR